VPFEQWGVLHELQAYLDNNRHPRVAIHIHHGVPGLNAGLWDKYLQPWRDRLYKHGCSFHLATMLRDPRERLESDWDFCNYIGYLGGPNAMSFCDFASENSNTQVKYLLRGSKWQWPEWWHRLNHSMDVQLLGDAKRMIEHFDIVGRTDELERFTSHLAGLLGINDDFDAAEKGLAVPKDNRTDWNNASSPDRYCLAHGSSVDEMLYATFCAN